MVQSGMLNTCVLRNKETLFGSEPYPDVTPVYFKPSAINDTTLPEFHMWFVFTDKFSGDVKQEYVTPCDETPAHLEIKVKLGIA